MRLTLPVEHPVLDRTAKRDTIEAHTPGLRALIIDDEEDVALALRDLVSHLKIAATVCTSAREALDLLASSNFDVVFADQRMPDMDGEEFHSRLIALNRAQSDRLAFVTGDMLGASAQAFLSRAGRPVLPKPFDLSALQNILKELGL